MMKRRGLRLLTLGPVIFFALILTSCQGDLLSAKPMDQKVSVSLGTMGKTMAAGKTRQLELRGNQGHSYIFPGNQKPAPTPNYGLSKPRPARTLDGGRLLNPEYGVVEIKVTAEDMEDIWWYWYYDPSDEGYSFSIPAGYDRYFEINLYDGDHKTLLASSSFKEDVVTSPTYLFATLFPRQTDGTGPDPILPGADYSRRFEFASDNFATWHVLSLRFPESILTDQDTQTGRILITDEDGEPVNLDDQYFYGHFELFDENGEKISFKYDSALLSGGIISGIPFWTWNSLRTDWYYFRSLNLLWYGPGTTSQIITLTSSVENPSVR